MQQLKVLLAFRCSQYALRPAKTGQQTIGFPAYTRRIASNPVFKDDGSSDVTIQDGGGRDAAPLDIQKLVLPDFKESKNAYASRTFLEVLRAYAVFRLCGVDLLVNNQAKILKALQRVVGTTLFHGLMRSTLYGQFLAGESNAEVLIRINRERASGILPMFAYTAAEIHGDIQSSISAAEIDELFATNMQAIHNAINIAAKSAEHLEIRPKVSSKLTFLALADTLRSVNEVIVSNNQWIDECLANDTAKLQGVLTEVSALLKTRDQDLWIQPSVSREILLEDLPSWRKNAAFHLELLAFRRQEGADLSIDTVDKLTALAKHIRDLSQHAATSDVRLVWDAEQTYIQDAIDVLVLDSMRAYNRQLPVVAGTYQCYLKRQLSTVELDLHLGAKEGFAVGLKVVRGAYIVEEQRLAKEHAYDDPINPSYDATSAMYCSVAECLLKTTVKAGAVTTQTTFATHNLDTVIHIVNRMKALDITPHGNEIAFAQLVGMRDYITYPLGGVGLPASKLFHYGPVLEGVAYMSRRVQENKGGIGTANLERQMLGRELMRRMTLRG